MGIVDTIKSASLFTKIALVCLIVANFLNGIAFSTTSWGVKESYTVVSNVKVFGTIINVGLWRVCSGTETGYLNEAIGSCADVTGSAQDWFAATQAFAVFGFFGIVGGLVLVLLFMFWKQNGDFLMVAAILCIVTGIFYLIGIIIFGVKFKDTPVVNTDLVLSWSFAFAIIAIVLEIVAGVLLLLEGKKGGSTSPA